jgi:hypothetical protein
VLVCVGVLFVALRGVHAAQDEPVPSPVTTETVVVVGIAGRYLPSDTDRQVLRDNADTAQVGAVAVRPRYVGDCAAAGWLTLGAGRRTAVAGRCDPRVSGERVADWASYVAAAAADNGDARPGTLAESVASCVAAVGPGAALAAAAPDGGLARYAPVEEFRADGYVPPCPITLVDAGAESDAVIAALAGRPGTTLVVTGVGPPPGSADPSLQVMYRVGAVPSGWLTSASTRRSGVVTLTDLTRTLIAFGQRNDLSAVPVDGALLAVEPAEVTPAVYADHLRAVRALSDAAPRGYLALGVLGAALFAMIVVGLLRRRVETPRMILLAGTLLGAAMMLTGSVPWQQSSEPAGMLVVALLVWWSVLLWLTLRLRRWTAVPPEVIAAALTVTAFTVDAALGAVMQAGSMLNSRPIFALRWYGFGNVTFAVYACAGLVLAGYVADRLLRRGRRTAALVAVAAIGFGVVICQGWPSMGSDFGGVIALTPPVLWLLLVLSGRKVTGVKVLAAGATAVVAISVISLLDWRRGAGQRSHLGDFVQRVVDGDALDIVARKAVASTQTMLHPLGIAAAVVGVALWLLVFRRLLPVAAEAFPTLRPVAIAAFATAVLGTLLNDGGISVWGTLTAMFTLTVASLWAGRSLAAGHLVWARPRQR